MSQPPIGQEAPALHGARCPDVLREGVGLGHADNFIDPHRFDRCQSTGVVLCAPNVTVRYAVRLRLLGSRPSTAPERQGLK